MYGACGHWHTRLCAWLTASKDPPGCSVDSSRCMARHIARDSKVRAALSLYHAAQACTRVAALQTCRMPPTKKVGGGPAWSAPGCWQLPATSQPPFHHYPCIHRASHHACKCSTVRPSQPALNPIPRYENSNASTLRLVDPRVEAPSWLRTAFAAWPVTGAPCVQW